MPPPFHPGEKPADLPRHALFPRLSSSMIIDESQLDEMFGILEKSLNQLKVELG
jgi:hypothetical protein